MVGSGSLQMVSKPISDLSVRVCLAPLGCSSVQPHNPMEHNEDVVLAWGVFVTSHIR